MVEDDHDVAEELCEGFVSLQALISKTIKDFCRGDAPSEITKAHGLLLMRGVSPNGKENARQSYGKRFRGEVKGICAGTKHSTKFYRCD